MNRKHTLALVGLLTSLSMISSPAAQAQTTATATITQIKVLENHDKNYKLFNGALWLDIDKAVNNYRWGGTHCKNRGLSDTNLQLLFAAFRAKFSITIDFDLVEAKGGAKYRCITGFTVERS